MSKTLIIAEKPSVATDLARVLGKVPKKDDYFENDELIIASAVGHLVELFMPDDIDKKYKAWLLGSLPIIPEKFELKPIENNKKKFDQLKRLMKRKEVTEIVNACDAGREGELIFRYLYDLAGVKKPIRRLWMVSMTPDGIREAWQHLRDGKELEPLADAARSRSEADWLVGINGTRALTTRMFGKRGRQVATVGRVQTPTLAMVMEREKEIRNFESRDFWRIMADFAIIQGEYQGVYQRPEFKKQGEHDRADRFWRKEEAEAVLAEVRVAGEGEVSDEKKRTRQSSPRLYDLTTLQREANGRYGFPAGKTLRVAQALYERHKVLTYPRTDSRALPNDYPSTVGDTLRKLPEPFAQFANEVVGNNWVNPKDKRVFDSSKVSDHFAIIPTGLVKKLSDDEQKIFDMVTRRFIAVFYPAAEFDETTRTTTVAGKHVFKTTGKVLVKPGWLAVYGKTPADSEVPPLDSNDGNPPQASLSEAKLEQDSTKPPPRYTEATLLSAMEGAGKLVEDEELAEAMKEKGIGTPATRASIIDHLCNEKYLERDQRHLVPTAKAEDLMNFLSAVKIDHLTSPSLTGNWEYQLNQVARGQKDRDEFMGGIIDLTKQIVERTKNFEEDISEMPDLPFDSPTDGKPMKESVRAYTSQDGEFQIFKTISGRKISVEEARELAENGKIGPLDDFRSKAGRPFSGVLKIEEGKVKFDFGRDDEDGGGLDLNKLGDYEVIGTDPNTGGKVYETPSAYVCEHYDPEDRKNKALRLSRNMLSRTLERHEVQALLKDRKTPLLEKFISKRTKRPFSAHLILKEDGKIGFEFPPRASKKTAKKATKKTAKKATKKTSG